MIDGLQDRNRNGYSSNHSSPIRDSQRGALHDGDSDAAFDDLEPADGMRASFSSIMDNLAGLSDRIKNIHSNIDTLDHIESGAPLPSGSTDMPYKLQSSPIRDSQGDTGPPDHLASSLQQKLRQLQNAAAAADADLKTKADGSSAQQAALEAMLADMRLSSLADYLRSIGVSNIDQLANMNVDDLVAGGVRSTVAKRLIATAKARADAALSEAEESRRAAATSQSAEHAEPNDDEPQLRKGWVRKVDERSGMEYYFNTITEERRYQLSPSMRKSKRGASSKFDS